MKKKALTNRQDLTLRKNGVDQAIKISLADSFLKRLKGLMYKNFLPADQALLIVPCKSIHTFFMRFDIDVVFIGENGLVLAIEHSMPPNKVSKPVKGCVKILELAAGTAQNLNLKIGDQLNF